MSPEAFEVLRRLGTAAAPAQVCELCAPALAARLADHVALPAARDRRRRGHRGHLGALLVPSVVHAAAVEGPVRG